MYTDRDKHLSLPVRYHGTFSITKNVKQNLLHLFLDPHRRNSTILLEPIAVHICSCQPMAPLTEQSYARHHPSLPDIFFRTHVKNRKRKAGEDRHMEAQPRRSSLERLRMLAYQPAYGAETCPLSAITRHPKSCPGNFPSPQIVLGREHFLSLPNKCPYAVAPPQLEPPPAVHP